jgi:hypothetical protein
MSTINNFYGYIFIMAQTPPIKGSARNEDFSFVKKKTKSRVIFYLRSMFSAIGSIKNFQKRENFTL